MSKLLRNPEVIWDTVDGTMVLCHTGTVTFFSLNPLGARIWAACDGCTPDELVAQVGAAYPDQDSGQVAADIREFVQAMEQAGLFQRQEA